MGKKFIDISEHNTILSYDAIATCGLTGVIIKATEGTTYQDKQRETHYNNLFGKIPIGFYHYLTSTSSPITQAQNFYNFLKDKQYNIKPVLDVEQDTLLSNAEWYSEQFIKEFKRLSGQDMIIYSGRYFIQDHFSTTFRQNNIWWVADYSKEPTINNCNIIAWQFSEKENNYAFVMGDLDCSILYNETLFFNKVSFDTIVNKNIGALQNELILQGFTDKNGKELIIDGIAGEKTLSACPTLKEGARGNITAWVQKQLGITQDGIFGQLTKQAVMGFQNYNGLQCDGIVGQETWKKLLGL